MSEEKPKQAKVRLTPNILQIAKEQAIRTWPAISPYIGKYRVRQANVRDSEGHPTMGVDDKLNWYYHPEAEFEPLHIISIAAHEACHIGLQHPQRFLKGGYTNLKAWSYAVDCEVNCRLVADGAEFPDGAIMPSIFNLPDGWSAEQYYFPIVEWLGEQEQEQQKSKEKGEGENGQPGKPGNDTGDERSGSSGSGDGESPPEDSDSQPGNGSDSQPGESAENQPEQSDNAAGGESGEPSQSNGEGSEGGDSQGESNSQGDSASEVGSGTGWGGSCADGVPREWEDGPGDPAEELEQQRELEKLGEQAGELAEREIAKVKQYGQGNEKGSHVAVAIQAQHSKAKARWHSRLRAITGSIIGYKSGPQDYSYKKLSRRESSSPEIIRPGMVKFRPVIAVVCDVSGSMSANDLKAAVGELLAIAPYGDVWVMPTETYVMEEHIFRADGNLSRAKLPAGGGTNMMDGIRYAFDKLPKRIGKKPDIVIVLTDGDTYWQHDYKPEKPVLVGIIVEKAACNENYYTYQEVPRWAKKLLIESGS